MIGRYTRRGLLNFFVTPLCCFVDMVTLPIGQRRRLWMTLTSASPYAIRMIDVDSWVPRPNKPLIYLGACIVAGLRLARERQVNVRVVPTERAIEESIELSHEIFNRVFRKAYRRLAE